MPARDDLSQGRWLPLSTWARAIAFLLVLLALVFWLASPAYAGHISYTNVCVSTDADYGSCLALAERLEQLLLVIEEHEIARTADHDEILLALSAIESNTTPSGSPAAVAGTVALSEGDAQRLDLIWIGVFLMGGISFGLMVAGYVKREGTRWGMG